MSGGLRVLFWLMIGAAVLVTAALVIGIGLEENWFRSKGDVAGICQMEDVTTLRERDGASAKGFLMGWEGRDDQAEFVAMSEDRKALRRWRLSQGDRGFGVNRGEEATFACAPNSAHQCFGWPISPSDRILSGEYAAGRGYLQVEQSGSALTVPFEWARPSLHLLPALGLCGQALALSVRPQLGRLPERPGLLATAPFAHWWSFSGSGLFHPQAVPRHADASWMMAPSGTQSLGCPMPSPEWAVTHAMSGGREVHLRLVGKAVGGGEVYRVLQAVPGGWSQSNRAPFWTGRLEQWDWIDETTTLIETSDVWGRAREWSVFSRGADGVMKPIWKESLDGRGLWLRVRGGQGWIRWPLKTWKPWGGTAYWLRRDKDAWTLRRWSVSRTNSLEDAGSALATSLPPEDLALVKMADDGRLESARIRCGVSAK